MIATPPRRRQQHRCVLGLDFGTLSGRALLVDLDTGAEVATAVHEYTDGVIEEHLPGDKNRLPPDTALQNPADYLRVLEIAIPKVLRAAKVSPEQVIGIGTDFTSCTMLPTLADGTPLCFDKRWRKNPHAWVKLWKHHAAQPEANRINELGQQRGEAFIQAYGGRYSSEWFFSKLLEIVNDAPAVYDATERFIEAGDWIVWQLCGVERRNLSAAGFKAMWVNPMQNAECKMQHEDGDALSNWSYPSPDFFKALHPKLENVVAEKLSAELFPLGSKAGGLTREMARRTGLREGTPVAVGTIDAHVAVPACGVTTPGKLVMIMGTSTCHLLIGETRREVEGVCGVIEHGVVSGAWGYEAGQAGVGDLFAWYIAQGVPASVHAEARKAGVNVYQLLEKRAATLHPGESGLLALDWWNGCRSVLMDSELTGLLIGATLATKPHEIYRALIEATAFGTRKIIEAFTQQGVPISELVGCGGLAQKNPLLMQIYADVTGRPIKVAASEQTCALGAAMHGAVAAGAYPDIHTAARKMARVREEVYQPNAKHKPIYDELYAEYTRLHDLFGRDPNSAMKVLKRLRVDCLVNAPRSTKTRNR
ncbi:MAG: ribulokinase [Verrucomicrobia bacterium]|nr:ribulokinase [Verrucomicrobiota bacterium]